MSANLIEEKKTISSASEIQVATFYIGDLLLGVDIQKVQEINRQTEFTVVPHAPNFVQGVSNLRGDVVTMVNLRTILQIPTSEESLEQRSVVIQSKGEQISLLVDRIADVLTIDSENFDPPPPNIGGIEGRFFDAVYTLENEFLVILNVDEVITES